MGDDAETAVLAGGYARIMQQLQRQSDGVISTRTGFMGGENDNPYSEASFKTLKFAASRPAKPPSGRAVLATARTRNPERFSSTQDPKS